MHVSSTWTATKPQGQRCSRAWLIRFSGPITNCRIDSTRTDWVLVRCAVAKPPITSRQCRLAGKW